MRGSEEMLPGHRLAFAPADRRAWSKSPEQWNSRRHGVCLPARGQAKASTQADRTIPFGAARTGIGLLFAMLGDVSGEIAEAGKDRAVFRIVGAQRDAVALRDDQRDLEQIDRIQAETLAE